MLWWWGGWGVIVIYGIVEHKLMLRQRIVHKYSSWILLGWLAVGLLFSFLFYSDRTDMVELIFNKWDMYCDYLNQYLLNLHDKLLKQGEQLMPKM